MSTVLALASITCAALAQQKPDDTQGVSACEVAAHPLEYAGQTLTFTGTFFHGEHGVYFIFEEVCERMAVWIHARGAVPGDPFSGQSELFTATGKLIVYHVKPARKGDEARDRFVFSVSKAKKVKP